MTTNPNKDSSPFLSRQSVPVDGGRLIMRKYADNALVLESGTDEPLIAVKSVDPFDKDNLVRGSLSKFSMNRRAWINIF